MRISTTNYADFRTLIKGLFGDKYVTFFGTKTSPHEKVVVMAMDGNTMIVYTSPYPLPESFTQEFLHVNCLSEISEVEWSP